MLFIDLAVLAWCFTVGASVGSFLNVVVWRLPQGMSILRPGSHCPRCRTPILLRDNVPVLGWLVLRGRCRACGAAISPRYPLVELVAGLAFAVLAWPELIGGGWNLPFLTADESTAASAPLSGTLAGIWLYHVTLMSLLLAIALFEFDGSRPPVRFLVVAVLAGLAPPVLWPQLRPESPREYAVLFGVQGGLLSGALGFCLGTSFDPRRGERWRALALAWGLALVGTFLVPGTIGVAVLVAGALVVLRLARFARIDVDMLPRTLLLFAATLAFLLLWGVFPEAVTIRGGFVNTAAPVIGAIVVLALLALFDRRPRS
ncbi:MAG: prepilin peptidase [Planctomycetia bacterium]|nr:prepilin peptidase [Planctomycetia bacterium]